MPQTTTPAPTSEQLTAHTRWADTVLARPAKGGALLEQRHVLDEAAHPHQTAAIYRLAHAA